VKVATVSPSKCLFGLSNPFLFPAINQISIGVMPRAVLATAQGTALGGLLGVDQEDEIRAELGVALSEELGLGTTALCWACRRRNA
jgi:hypothetical protein